MSARHDTAAHGMSEINVGMADYAVARGDVTLVTVGLGSCVAIALYDRAGAVGGLAHIVLPAPEQSRDPGNPAKFPCTVLPLLQEEMQSLGAAGPLTARLIGGASMFRALLVNGGVNVGERNVQAARAALARHRVKLVGEDTGGEHGRSVFFNLRTGRVRVRSLKVGDREL